MSKGSPVVLVRFPRDEHAAMKDQIARSNWHRKGEPWDQSEFVRVAVREKLAKMRRSARNRVRRRESKRG